jgi:hypothetical protein
MDIKDGQVRGSQTIGASVNYSPEFDAAGPNANLLRRLVESSGGKMLELENALENPFAHDRQKTFQPEDLWEWLLKLAVILFPVDVGVRRIQMDRAEWHKALATLRRWLFFWRPDESPRSADESLAALLARRGQVRSSTTAPGLAPAPELFQPRQAPTIPAPDSPLASTAEPVSPPTPPDQSSAPAPTTTSRLLAAKRRAQQRRN